MKVKAIWLRRIHKWVGLVIGLQFLIWAMSGAAMALLDMGEVAGGEKREVPSPPLPPAGTAWPRVQGALSGQPVTALAVRDLPRGHVIAATTASGVHLFDARDGSPIAIDRGKAAEIARAAHPEKTQPARVSPLAGITVAVREHSLPIWQVDFNDAMDSSYYVSGSTGELLERRNSTWRLWDFFWMLHNMDYANRTSFNHPLIVMVGFAMVWLAVTGLWLLFRTMWRHDFVRFRK